MEKFLIITLCICMGIYILKRTIIGKIIVVLIKGLWMVLKPILNIILILFGSTFRIGDPWDDASKATGRWKTWFELRKVFSYKHDGVIISGNPDHRLTQQSSFDQILVVSPTGGGKTTSFTFPNLGYATGGNSMVVFDPNGTALKTFGGYLSQYYKIKVLSDDPSISLHFNPLYYCNDITDIKKVLDLVIEASDSTQKGDSKFWMDQSRSIMQVIMVALFNDDEILFKNFHNLLHIINNMDAECSNEKIQNFLEKNITEPQIWSQLQGFLNQDAKVKNNVLSTCKSLLEKQNDPKIAELMNVDTLDLRSIRREPTVIFISFDQADLKYYRFILNTFFSSLFKILLEMPPEDDQEEFLAVNVYCEEMPQYHIKGLDDLISVLRARKVNLNLIVQSLSQIYNIYGRDAGTTIINNCNHKIFFGNCDMPTCREISEMLGYGSFKHWPDNKRFTGEKPKYLNKPLLNAEEVRRIKDEIIYIDKGHPALLKLLPYYKQRELVKRSNLPLNLEKEMVTLPVIYMDLMSETEPMSTFEDLDSEDIPGIEEEENPFLKTGRQTG